MGNEKNHYLCRELSEMVKDFIRWYLKLHMHYSMQGLYSNFIGDGGTRSFSLELEIKETKRHQC